MPNTNTSRVVFVHPNIDDHLTRDGRRYHFVDCVMQDSDGALANRSYRFDKYGEAMQARDSLNQFRKTGLPVRV